MFYVCTLEVSAPEGSGYLGDQILSGMCVPESNFDAMSFQQNFLECNCPALFSLLFTGSSALTDEIDSNISNCARFSTFGSCQWIPLKTINLLLRWRPLIDWDAPRSPSDAIFLHGICGTLGPCYLKRTFAAPLAAKSIRFARSG